MRIFFFWLSESKKDSPHRQNSHLGLPPQDSAGTNIIRRQKVLRGHHQEKGSTIVPLQFRKDLQSLLQNCFRTNNGKIHTCLSFDVPTYLADLVSSRFYIGFCDYRSFKRGNDFLLSVRFRCLPTKGAVESTTPQSCSEKHLSFDRLPDLGCVHIRPRSSQHNETVEKPDWKHTTRHLVNGQNWSFRTGMGHKRPRSLVPL